MKPADLTLVISSYNRAPLIADTVSSALNQNRRFRDVIVVDDGSTDDTLSVLARFGGDITVIASGKGGMQRARNKGVRAARSEYVTLCDSGDLIEPDYVELIGAWLEVNPGCDSVYCNFSSFGDGRGLVEKFALAPAGYFDGAFERDGFLLDVPDLYAKTTEYQPFFPTGLTIRKSVYAAIGGFDPAFNGIGSEDWEFTLRVIEQGNLALCAMPLVRIRKHAVNDAKESLRRLLGEIVVLEHALAHHRSAEEHREALLAGIERRRIAAFELAFGSRRYDDAVALLGQIRHKPTHLKFRVKRALTRLYGVRARLRPHARA